MKTLSCSHFSLSNSFILQSFHEENIDSQRQMYISVWKIMLFNLIQLYQFKWRMIFKKHVKYYLMKKIRFCVTVSEKTVLLEQFFLSKWKIRILFENCAENREYFLNCQKNLIRKSLNEQNKIIFFLKWQCNQQPNYAHQHRI